MFFLVRHIGDALIYGFHITIITLSAIVVFGSMYSISPNGPEIIRKHYKLYITMLLAAICMLIPSITALVRHNAPDDANILPGMVASYFFEIGFPPLAFSTLMEVLRIAALPRIRYMTAEKRKITTNLIYVVDVFVVGVLLGATITVIELGVECKTVLDFLLFQKVQFDYIVIAFWVLFMIQLILSRNDIPMILPSLWTPVFFLTCVTIGTIVVVARAPMPPRKNFSLWMVKITLIKMCGCFAMMSILAFAPTIWLLRLLEAYSNVQPPGTEENEMDVPHHDPLVPCHDTGIVLPIASSFMNDAERSHYLLPKRNDVHV